LKKDIEALIRTKACSIFEKHYSNQPDKSPSCKKYNKETIIQEISLILKKTLVTPRRKRHLELKFPLSARDTFGADSNLFFSPNFEDSLDYLSPSYALNLFKNKYVLNRNKYYAKEHRMLQRTYGIIPWFSLKELAYLLKYFSDYLEENSWPLVKTGWPEYNFTGSIWLFCKLAPNYPMNLPKYIKNYQHIKNTRRDPYFFTKKNFLHKNKQFQKYQSQSKLLRKILTFKELVYIEEMREKFLGLKKAVLCEITQHLFLKSTDKDLWLQDCLGMLYGRFSEKDLEMIKIIDKKYGQVKIFSYPLNGGLQSLIDIILFCYEECKFERMTLETEMMKSLLNGSKYADQKYFRSYYQLEQFNENKQEKKCFYSMMNQLKHDLEKIDEQIAENKSFIADTMERAKKESLNVICMIKQKHYPFINNLLEFIESGEKIEIGLSFLKQYPLLSNKKIIPLELPSGTRWEHITIQFLDYDKVKILAPYQFKKITNFRKMGFENLKNGKPNKQWDLLYDLSRYRGDLTWTISTYRKRVDSHPLSTPKIRKQIERLSESLKQYFNIDEPPFYDYIKFKAYKTRFFLLPDPLNSEKLCDVTE